MDYVSYKNQSNSLDTYYRNTRCRLLTKQNDLLGPLTITGVAASSGTSIQYRIDRASDVQPEIKYNAALNSDGNRLAVAQQNGTNSVTRVYEYDGSNWIQLGEDVQ